MQSRFLSPLLILPAAFFVEPQAQQQPWPTKPVETIRHLERGLESGDASVLWQQLPASYQRDVDQLVDLFADEMDPDVWKAVVGLVGSLGELIDEQRGLILEMVGEEADLEDMSPAELDAAMDTAAQMLKGFASGPFGTLEKLKAADLGQVVGDSMGWILEQSMGSGESFGDLGIVLDPNRPLVVELVERQGDRATLRVGATKDALETIELRQVESKWVFAELADTWEAELAKAREGLTGMFGPDSTVSASTLIQLIGTAQGVVDDLTVAETREEFEMSARMGMFTLMGAAFGSGLGEALMGQGGGLGPMGGGR